MMENYHTNPIWKKYFITVPGNYRNAFYEYCAQNNILYKPFPLTMGNDAVFTCFFETDSVFEEFKSQCIIQTDGSFVFIGNDPSSVHLVISQIATDEDIVSKVIKILYGDTTMDAGLYADIREAIKKTIEVLTERNDLE